MKLILTVEALAPRLTGIGRYSWELATGLSAHAAVAELRYLRQGQWVQDLPPLLQASGPAKRSPWSIRKPRWARELGLKWACRQRLVHGPNYFLPPSAELGVVTVHDLSVFKFPETHPAERIKQFEREFARSVAQAAHLITDSEATRQELIEFLACPATKVTAVPLGVSPRYGRHSDDQLLAGLSPYKLARGSYVLCVSTLEPRKKIAQLLHTYRRMPATLRQRYPLVLAGGEGWLNEQLHHDIELGEREGWLRYLGYVPEADLPLLYAGARLFVYPSIYEGFGLPVLEAMASGTPVVTSDRSSLPEVTRGAALLVDPDDIDALGRAIEAGLVDDAWRSMAVAAGLGIAREHSWPSCVDATVAVYQKVLAAQAEARL